MRIGYHFRIGIVTDNVFNYLLFKIVEINECPTSQCKVVFAFYLAFVKQCTVDEDVDAAIDAAPLSDLPKVFYRLTTMVEFDSFVATHGPATDVYGMDMEADVK